MAKKYWISIPLYTASEANDAAVVSFLKGGLKKELEVETAIFITKWMLDKSVPFVIAADNSSPERNLGVAPASPGVGDGAAVPVVAETDKAVKAEDVTQHGADTTVEQIGDAPPVAAEPPGEQAEVYNDEPASQLNPSHAVGRGQARGKAKRRVPEASNA